MLIDSRLNKDNRGFTLLEVLVALTILAVALLGLLSMVGGTMRAMDSGKRQTQAINLVSEKLEMLKAVPFANIQNISGSAGGLTWACSGADPVFTCTPSPATVTIDSLTYSWSWTVTYIDLDGDGETVNDDGLFDQSDIKRVDITVTWTDLLGDHSTTLTVLREV